MKSYAFRIDLVGGAHHEDTIQAESVWDAHAIVEGTAITEPWYGDVISIGIELVPFAFKASGKTAG